MRNPRTEAQHIVPQDGKWGVRAENSKKPSKLFNSKVMATAYAFDIADNNDGKVVIHRNDGTFKTIKKTDNSSRLITMLNA